MEGERKIVSESDEADRWKFDSLCNQNIITSLKQKLQLLDKLYLKQLEKKRKLKKLVISLNEKIEKRDDVIRSVKRVVGCIEVVDEVGFLRHTGLDTLIDLERNSLKERRYYPINFESKVSHHIPITGDEQSEEDPYKMEEVD